MDWLARSEDCRRNQPAQTYARHRNGVRAHVARFLAPLAKLLAPDLFAVLRETLVVSLEYHDLGKLDDVNQEVLSGHRKAKKLPIVHSDAGVVALRAEHFKAALLVAAHHIGLPNIVQLANQSEGELLRADIPPAERMRDNLPLLLARHKEACGTADLQARETELPDTGDLAVFFRMALSILVDADHSDSSRPERPLQDIESEASVALLPEKRLAALDAFVAQYPKNSERNQLRANIYREYRTRTIADNIVACDSPVGSGKTTAVMAHLLAVAKARGLRRIFVILPFTNIIRQSAETYRKSLVLLGENPDAVVTEVHHLADFDDEASRSYATQWNAPIVVTTAVAFFETLASARPSALRRLHQLAGSAVFVDEAHAALPARFLPLAWKWMRSYAKDWNVHWVLASGSLVRFWEFPEVRRPLLDLPEEPAATVPILTSAPLRERSDSYERERVRFETLADALSVEGLADVVAATPGPRLVILNTVQNAAVTARHFRDSGKFATVCHISTALTPADREKSLAAVQARLKTEWDGNWVLVGTSCIEAGMNLDFATGFREIASLTSLLQAAGRVNRNGARPGAVMYSFRFVPDALLNTNRSILDSIHVLNRLLAQHADISPALCTQALREEIMLNPKAENAFAKLYKLESVLNFPDVERHFKIIASDTRTVIISPDLVRQLEAFALVDWREIQRHSVQIWGYNVEKLAIPALANHADIFKWHLAYSSFLGYMDGVLQCEDFELGAGGVI